MNKSLNMRKVIFLTVACLFSIISSVIAQNNDCSMVQLNAPIEAQWSVVNTYDWAGIANLTGDTASFCLPNGCFYLYTFADGINWDFTALSLSIDNLPLNLDWQYTDSTGYGIAYFEWNATSGCLDINACNYNPNANCADFNLCTYDCFGCTDATASNFNPAASVDNGTCCFAQWATINVSDSAYISVSNSLGNYIVGGDNYYYMNPLAFCCAPGCYQIYVSGIDEDAYQVVISDNNNNTLWEESFQDGFWNTISMSNDPIEGCMDFSACNYNPMANCHDGTCDYYSCQGCTDSLASNYNPNATIDNGSCCFGPLANIQVPNDVYWYFYSSTHYLSGIGSTGICVAPGCATFYAYNSTYAPFDYAITDANNNIIISGNSEDPTIEWDDISTIHIPFTYGDIISGCNDPNACNFNPAANCLDYNLCDYSCQGCTDASAFNYNPLATVDNGSCCYDLYYSITIADPATVGWWVTDGFGQVIAACDNVNTTQGFCSPINCITFHFQSYLGIPTPISIELNGANFYNGMITNAFEELSFNATETVGCGDASACNYNPNATCLQYNVCDYSCLGCTDPNAINFNPNATLDNGTCCSDQNWQTLSSTGSLFFYAFAGDGTTYTQGYYPNENGFCMNASCYQLYVYSTDGNLQEISISNSNQENYYSFYTQPYLGYNIENIGLNNEIAGCTDSLACNYNPEATCDYGYCEYYCGGCTDPQALNYNENALFDDNTCSFQVLSPMVGMQMIADESNDQFYVMISLTQMGNTYPYAITNSINSDMMTMTDVGTSMAGPFNCGDSVQFHLHSLGFNMNTLMTSPVYKMACNATDITLADTNTIQMYPNPAQDFFILSGATPNGEVIVKDTFGRIILSQLLQGNAEYISTKTWSSGMYIVELKDNQNIRKFKLQVIH